MNTNAYKVLIVDDEEDLLEICADTLEMEGFNVFTAINGVNALEVLEKETVDVIISDAFMPEMSGEELLVELGKIEFEKRPLFYLSTGAIDADEESLKSKGATGLISKPFDIDDMIERLKKDLENN